MTGEDQQAVDLVAHNLGACPGCGLELAGRVLLAEAGPKAVVTLAPGCGAMFAGQGLSTPLRLPALMSTPADAVSFAAGIKAGFEIQGRDDISVLALAGDGATADVGLTALSGALERGDRLVYVCFDNELYASGDVPVGPARPRRARAAAPQPLRRKNLLEIVAAHDLPYAATASIGAVDDFKRKIGQALSASRRGTAFLLVHTPCPPGWGCDPSKTIEMARNAIRSKYWVLGEIFDGEKTVLSPLPETMPVAEYLRPQKRFAGLTEDQLIAAQLRVDRYYNLLQRRAAD